jgi:YtfJ family uncharacterized protein
MKKTVISLLLAPILAFALEIGEVPLHVTLDGDNGGLVSGSAWSSTMLKDKVYVVFYVDPDEKEANAPLTEALKAKNFNRDFYGSVAIINMAATWLPNFAIASSLKEKQEKFPHTVYVKDLNKVLVKEWNLADDSSDILVFDKEGKLIYLHEGKLDDTQIQKVISLIEQNL